MDTRKKIIHFNSPEGAVWRYETAEDLLNKEIERNEQRNKIINAHISQTKVIERGIK